MTTRRKTVKNRPVPGRFSKSSVMCEWLKVHSDSFNCDYHIDSANHNYLFFEKLIPCDSVLLSKRTSAEHEFPHIKTTFCTKRTSAENEFLYRTNIYRKTKFCTQKNQQKTNDCKKELHKKNCYINKCLR